MGNSSSDDRACAFLLHWSYFRLSEVLALNLSASRRNRTIHLSISLPIHMYSLFICIFLFWTNIPFSFEINLRELYGSARYSASSLVHYLVGTSTRCYCLAHHIYSAYLLQTGMAPDQHIIFLWEPNDPIYHQTELNHGAAFWIEYNFLADGE